MATARRGDLICVTSVYRDFLVGKGAYTSKRVDVGVITSVTEQGIARAWKPIDGDQALELNKHQQRWKIIEADRVRVPDVLAMVEGQLPDRYASEAELRDALEPHLTVHIKNLPTLT